MSFLIILNSTIIYKNELQYKAFLSLKYSIKFKIGEILLKDVSNLHIKTKWQ